MPILTLRLSEREIAAAELAAKKHKMTRSEFARRAINSASQAKPKQDRSYPFGVLKGRITYEAAMKLLRD